MTDSLRLLFADKVEQMSKAVTALTPEAMAKMYRKECRNHSIPFLSIPFRTVENYNGEGIEVTGEVIAGPKWKEFDDEDWWTQMDVSTNTYNKNLPLTLRFVAQDAICGLAHKLAAYEDGKLEQDWTASLAEAANEEDVLAMLFECCDKKAKTIDCAELYVCARVMLMEY